MQHSLDYPMVRMKIILRNLLSGKTMRAIYVYRKLSLTYNLKTKGFVKDWVYSHSTFNWWDIIWQSGAV